jgi:TonB family protein
VATGQSTDSFLLRGEDRSEKILRHFGLREQPFGVTPDPAFLFSSRMHRTALQSMIGAIEANLGFTVLLGDPGMGKTTLLFRLLTLYRDSARTGFIFQTQCKRHDLLRHLASELELSTERSDEVSLHQALKEMLVTEATAGRKVLVIIDEAQNLEVSTLETIRLLSDFETTRAKLLHIVLAGSARLNDTLASPELSQLAQRISTVCRLYRLSRDEVGTYVTFRLGVAGHLAADSLFSAEAIAEVAEQSRGIPRVVNSICYGALSLASIAGTRQVSRTLVQQAAQNLELSQQCTQDSALGRIKEPRPLEGYVQTSWPSVEMAAREKAGLDVHEVRPEPVTAPFTEVIPSRVPTPAHGIARGQLQPSHPKGRVTASLESGLAQPTQLKRNAPKNTPGQSSRILPNILRSNGSGLAAAALAIMALILWVSWYQLRSEPGVSNQGLTPVTGSVPNLNEASQPKAAGTVPEALQSHSPAEVADASNNIMPSPTDRRSTEARNARTAIVEMLPLLPSKLIRRSGSEPENPAAQTSPPMLGGSGKSLSPLTGVWGTPRPSSVGLQPNAGIAGTPPMQLGKPVKIVEPEYPKDAKLRHLQGDVLLELQVDSGGDVRNVRNLNGNALLSEAAEKAAWQWRYRPFTGDNASKLAVTWVRFTFKLNADDKK